ncbi:MAG: hypothetical protein F6K55_05010 [Moorea sp. SIO4A3]|nr:hypothetical protein [Moorena sp. SIO4A3]
MLIAECLRFFFTVDLLQKYFSDSVYVNSCPLFPVPYSLFPTTAAKSSIGPTEAFPKSTRSLIHTSIEQPRGFN